MTNRRPEAVLLQTSIVTWFELWELDKNYHGEQNCYWCATDLRGLKWGYNFWGKGVHVCFGYIHPWQRTGAEFL